MTINTYATLRAAVRTRHPDGPAPSFDDDDVKEFFAEMQAKMYFGDDTPGMATVDPLRIRQMVASGTVTPDADGEFSILSDVDANWLEFHDLVPTYQGALSLNYVEPWQFAKLKAQGNTTPPAAIYTVEGDTVMTYPAASSTLVATWYEKFAALSADSDTDWLILNHYSVYLNGCLAEACTFTNAPEEAKYRAMFAGSVAALNANDRRARMSGSPLVARPRAIA